jgi:P-type E1-E2 ATPase
MFNDREKQIEMGMSLLGCSAVDDQMQEHVPDTVDFLLKAKIQIIVLTGDKLEVRRRRRKCARMRPN